MFDIAIDKVLHSGERRFHLQLQWRSAHRRVVLLGGSGAGKTLTLKAMAGLLQPDAGHVRLAGRTLFDAEQGINLTPQSSNQTPVCCRTFLGWCQFPFDLFTSQPDDLGFQFFHHVGHGGAPRFDAFLSD